MEPGLDIKIARLEYRIETLTEKVDRLSTKLDAVDRLTTYGRVIVSVLMALGVFFGWVLSQIRAFQNVFGPHP